MKGDGERKHQRREEREEEEGGAGGRRRRCSRKRLAMKNASLKSEHLNNLRRRQ